MSEVDADDVAYLLARMDETFVADTSVLVEIEPYGGSRQPFLIGRGALGDKGLGGWVAIPASVNRLRQEL